MANNIPRTPGKKLTNKSNKENQKLDLKSPSLNLNVEAAARSNSYSLA